MIASATTNIAIALGTSGVGIAILVVLRSRRNRTRVVASPVSETVTDSAPIVVTEVVVAQEEAPIEVVPEAVAEVAVAPSVREKAGRTRSLFASAFQSIRGRGIDSATWD